MSNFSSWWDALPFIEQVYWGIAIPASLIFLIQTVMTFIGADMDSDMDSVDVDMDADQGIGFQFFSFKNFVAFFTLFSWTGIACLDSGYGNGITLLIAIFAGLAMMAVMASLFYFISKLNDSGTMSMRNAIGNIGEVYLPIKAARNNVGQVSIKVQGAYHELDAITDDLNDLAVGSVIEVVDIANDNILIITKSTR